MLLLYYCTSTKYKGIVCTYLHIISFCNSCSFCFATIVWYAMQLRVEDKRQTREGPFWGRESPPKRDLPAFWSIDAHGQPFNDERLTMGAPNFYKVLSPRPLSAKERKRAGPASEVSMNLRRLGWWIEILYKYKEFSQQLSLSYIVK